MNRKIVSLVLVVALVGVSVAALPTGFAAEKQIEPAPGRQCTSGQTDTDCYYRDGNGDWQYCAYWNGSSCGV